VFFFLISIVSSKADEQGCKKGEKQYPTPDCAAVTKVRKVREARCAPELQCFTLSWFLSFCLFSQARMYTKASELKEPSNSVQVNRVYRVKIQP
jgi:hypothetical protein